MPSGELVNQTYVHLLQAVFGGLRKRRIQYCVSERFEFLGLVISHSGLGGADGSCDKGLVLCKPLPTEAIYTLFKITKSLRNGFHPLITTLCEGGSDNQRKQLGCGTTDDRY